MEQKTTRPPWFDVIFIWTLYSSVCTVLSSFFQELPNPLVSGVVAGTVIYLFKQFYNHKASKRSIFN